MRGEALLRLVMCETHPRQIVFIDNAQDFGRADDRHIGPCRDPFVQFSFKVWLVEPVTWMPAKRTYLLGPRPVQHQFHIAVDELCPDIDARVTANALGQSN